MSDIDHQDHAPSGGARHTKPAAPAPGKRRRRPGVTLIVAGLLLIAALWSGYWYAAYSVVSRFVGTAEAGSSRGAVTCADRALGGFPFHIAVDCAVLAAEDAGIGASLGGVSATAPLYNPGRVEAVAEGPLAIRAADLGFAAEAAWEHAQASLVAGLSGLSRAESAAEGVQVDLRGGGLPVSSLFVERWQSSLEQAGGEEPGIRLGVSATDLSARLNDGTALPIISGVGRIHLIDAGPIDGFDVAALLNDWIAQGGRLELEQLQVGSGGSTLSLEGPLSISPEGLLNGTVTVRFSGAEALSALIGQVLPGYRAQAEAMVNALVALTQPVETPDGPAQETRLTVRDGVVGIGIIPFFTIPPVRLAG